MLGLNDDKLDKVDKIFTLNVAEVDPFKFVLIIFEIVVEPNTVVCEF